MKKIKEIKMFGEVWKVNVKKNNNKDAGGDFSFSKKTITINDRFGEFEMILLHEILEAILLNNFCRFYGQEGNMEYRFFFNHTDYSKIVCDFTQVLKDNNLLKNL